MKLKEKSLPGPSSTKILTRLPEELTGIQPVRCFNGIESEAGEINTGVVFHHR